jgi:hypothetical protein
MESFGVFRPLGLAPKMRGDVGDEARGAARKDMSKGTGLN